MLAWNATGRRALAALLGPWAAPGAAPVQSAAARPRSDCTPPAAKPDSCPRLSDWHPELGVPLECTLKAIEVDDSGQDNGMEAFILAALEQRPARADLRLKLLELYHAAGDIRAFNKQARLYIQHNHGERGVHWSDVRRMGLDLVPGWSPQQA